MLLLGIANHFDGVSIAGDVEVADHASDGAVGAFVCFERGVHSEQRGQ